MCVIFWRAVRVIEVGATIGPFGERAGEIPLFGSTFAQLREDEVRASRVKPERLTFAEHAFAAAPLLSALARHAPKPGRPSALALDAQSPQRHHVPVSSVREGDGLLVFDVFLDAPPGASLEELRREALPVRVPHAAATRRRELSRAGPPPHHLELPADGIVAAHLEHWVHLLWLAPLLVPRMLARAAGSAVRSALSAVPSVVGEGARVHHTAYLEGAVIGPGAEIGPFASIRHSTIGARARISDHTKVSFSVLGEETHTLSDASFSHVVALGGGTLASLLLRDVVLGRSVFLTSGVIFWNEVLEGTITVEHHGQEVDTRRKALGGCAGHGCVLGARTIISPGRALPNRTTVVMRREEGVLKVEDAKPGTPMCWHDAALVPAARLLPEGQVPDEVAA